MKYFKIDILIFTVFCAFLSCKKKSSCLKSTGSNITEIRTLSTNISSIILKDNVNLVLTQDNNLSLKVEGGTNLLPYVNTKIDGNTLTITNDNKCNFLRTYSKDITVYLTTPNINTINYTGYGNITSTNTFTIDKLNFETRNGTGSINLSLKVNNLKIIQHAGPADFTINGSANNTYIYTGGGGWFYLKNLASNAIHVNTNGEGDVQVNPIQTLLVELTSIGNVMYYGNPVLTVSVHTGRGKIIKK